MKAVVTKEMDILAAVQLFGLTSDMTSASTRWCAQDKPWAIFGTCLGAIVAYEVTQRVAERKHAPLPVAIFPAAVSAPHLYALAVMKLYVEHAVGASSCRPLVFSSAADCHLLQPQYTQENAMLVSLAPGHNL